MGVYHTTCVTVGDPDLASLRARDVRYGFVVHLPFRLRVGDWYRHSLDIGERAFTLCFINRVSVPATVGGDYHPTAPFSVYYTEVLVILDNPKIDEQALEPLRAAEDLSAVKEYPRSSGDLYHAMEAINNFLVGYATATGQIFGGSPLRLFGAHDFNDQLTWEITILGRSEEPVSDADAKQMLDLKPERQIEMVSTFTGELSDLPAADLERIQHSIDLHEEFLFYEFAFEAKTKMVDGDYSGALLMAVAALEGAHAVYVSEALAQRMPADSDEQLADKFLRELGMSLCVQLTPYLLMEPSSRPAPELIARAEKALVYRNEIMHALRNKKGQYRRRNRTNKELSDAYSAALKMFECYRSAFEALREPRSTGDATSPRNA